jgi:hypothetical protein
MPPDTRRSGPEIATPQAASSESRFTAVDPHTVTQAALTYAALGWPVFPCHTTTPVGCSCGDADCDHPGKHPRTLRGKDDATTDPSIIRAWWKRWPTANLAIRTGAPAVDVLDVDVREEGNGWPAFNRLVRAGMLTGAIRLVRTRSGGLHVYYPGTDQGCRSLRGLWIDFKATGGYVLAPPSVVEGKPYELLEARPGGRALDFGKVERIVRPPTLKLSAGAKFSRSGGVGALARWLEGQQRGNRNNALYWAALRAAENGCTDADFEHLVQAAVAIDLTRTAAEKTVASARRRIGASA